MRLLPSCLCLLPCAALVASPRSGAHGRGVALRVVAEPEAAVGAVTLETVRAAAAAGSADVFEEALGSLGSAVDAVRALDIALQTPELLRTKTFAVALRTIAGRAPSAAAGPLVGHTMARLRTAAIAPDDEVLRALCSALLKARKDTQALAASDALTGTKTPADLRDAIVAAARLNDAERVKDLMTQLLRMVGPQTTGGIDGGLSESGAATMLSGGALKFALKVLSKAGDQRTCFSIVDSLPVELRSVPMYHAAITACGKTRPMKGRTAMVLWKKMKADGLTVPRSTYNALLHAAQGAELSDATTALLSEMSRKNVSLNVVSYNIALNSLASTGRFSEIIDLLEAMEASSIVPTDVTFGTAIYGAARANNSAAAVELLKAQRRLRIAPADAAFGAALEACLNDPDGAQAAASATNIVDIMADVQCTLERRERIESLAREALHRGVLDGARLKRDEDILGMVLRNRQQEV